uniref:Uncharacterized protein n=1 Tax=Arundo donax TaxID=35708 RepID=A0A0A9BIZ2_ARUDO
MVSVNTHFERGSTGMASSDLAYVISLPLCLAYTTPSLPPQYLFEFCSELWWLTSYLCRYAQPSLHRSLCCAAHDQIWPSSGCGVAASSDGDEEDKLDGSRVYCGFIWCVLIVNLRGQGR